MAKMNDENIYNKTNFIKRRLEKEYGIDFRVYIDEVNESICTPMYEPIKYVISEVIRVEFVDNTGIYQDPRFDSNTPVHTIIKSIGKMYKVTNIEDRKKMEEEEMVNQELAVKMGEMMNTLTTSTMDYNKELQKDTVELYRESYDRTKDGFDELLKIKEEAAKLSVENSYAKENKELKEKLIVAENNFNEKVLKINNDANEKVITLERKLSNIENSHKNEINDVKQRYEDVIKSKNNNLEDTVRLYCKEIDDINIAHENEINKLNSEIEAKNETSDLNTTNIKKLDVVTNLLLLSFAVNLVFLVIYIITVSV